MHWGRWRDPSSSELVSQNILYLECVTNPSRHTAKVRLYSKGNLYIPCLLQVSQQVWKKVIIIVKEKGTLNEICSEGGEKEEGAQRQMDKRLVG